MREKYHSPKRENFLRGREKEHQKRKKIPEAEVEAEKLQETGKIRFEAGNIRSPFFVAFGTNLWRCISLVLRLAYLAYKVLLGVARLHLRTWLARCIVLLFSFIVSPQFSWWYGWLLHLWPRIRAWNLFQSELCLCSFFGTKSWHSCWFSHRFFSSFLSARTNINHVWFGTAVI